MDAHHDHCPFLNRSDSRCAEHLSLDNLPFAFEHCCDNYSACPLYAELLSERRLRRDAVVGAGCGLAHASPHLQVTVYRRSPQPLRASA